MKRVLPILSIIATFILVGCATSQTTTISLTNEFDAQKAGSLLEPGNNTIIGSALLRQSGGGVVTCAGGTVYLIPATRYASERMGHIYGSGIKGFNYGKTFLFNPDPDSFKIFMKKATCDVDGFFEFDEVGDGYFYVVTGITWKVGNRSQGGYLMHYVGLSGGEKKKLVLSQ